MSTLKEYLYKLVNGEIKGPLAGFLRGILFLFSLIYGLAVVILVFIYRKGKIEYRPFINF